MGGDRVGSGPREVRGCMLPVCYVSWGLYHCVMPNYAQVALQTCVHLSPEVTAPQP